MSDQGVTWAGVMPAITTPFSEDGSVDQDFLGKHVSWLVDNGATGIVPCGSLGEGATLTLEEKRAVIETSVKAVDGRVPVIPGIAALSTEGAVALAHAGQEVGCRGLMVLPPYVHKGPWSEIVDHFHAIFECTELPCMLYNNPIAYGHDVLPDQIAAFADRHANMGAVKESSGDIRRMTAIRALCGDRLALFAGLDDIIVEGIGVGATGWVAGLVNAFPKESVAVFDAAMSGDHERARALYEWFLPLLRLDTVPEFVQLIKLVQQEVGMGNERCRAPRTPALGAQRADALAVIKTAIETRPEV